MTRIHPRPHRSGLGRAVEDEILSLSQRLQIETLMGSRHMARDVGLERLLDRPARASKRLWFF